MNRRLLLVAFVPLALIFLFIWIVAGNDRLFRSTVPIEQRLVSHNESIRKKAQQELLGLESDDKRRVAANLIPVLEKEDAFVRKWAAISLALVGSAAQEAIPALLQSLSAKEKDVAQAARVALSEIGAPDVQQLPSLIRALQDPQDTVRCEAALSIGKMGPGAREAVPLIVGFLQRPVKTPACFDEAAAALAASIPDIVPVVLDLLSSEETEIRRKAARVLALSGVKSTETIHALFEILSREEDRIVRERLAKALQLPYTPEAARFAVLAAALRTPDDRIRLEAARAMRQIAPKGRKSHPLILRMLRDRDPAIRRLGLETLRKSGERSVDLSQRVAKAQRDPDPGVRCRAAEALIEAGANDRVSIALLIEDLKKDEDTARCAEDVLALAGLFDAEVTRSMIRLLEQDAEPDLRSRAARVLMHLGPRAQEAIPALVRAQKDNIPGTKMALKAVRLPPARKRR